MEETNHFLKNLLSLMPWHIYWKDKEGRYKGCNNEHLKSLGLKSLDDIIDKKDKDLVWSKQAKKLREIDLEVMSTGLERVAEEEVQLADGTFAIFLTKKVPLRDDTGIIIGILGISIDITKRKETEQKLADQIKQTEQAYFFLSQFVSTASHEITQYVANLTYSVNSIQEKIDSIKKLIYGPILDKLNLLKDADEIKEFNNIYNEITEEIEQHRKESIDALASLKHLGDVHSLYTKGVKLNFKETSIVDLINSALHDSPYTNKREIDFIKNIDNSIPKKIIIDYTNISKVLSIIIGNAIRFSHKDGVVVMNAKIRNSHIMISVQDFGKGMLETQLTNIFNNFINNTTADKKKTNGQASVRLSQAKLLIEASGGNIHIESTHEKGTTVTIQFPFKDIKYSVDGHIDGIDNTFKGLKAFILEDNLTTLKKETDIIESLGFSVESANNGKKAINLIEKKKFDIYFIDIGLPDINGTLIIEEIRKLHGDMLPIIVVTSHTSNEDEDLYLSVGATEMLEKPISKSRLNEILETLKVSRLLKNHR